MRHRVEGESARPLGRVVAEEVCHVAVRHLVQNDGRHDDAEDDDLLLGDVVVHHKRDDEDDAGSDPQRVLGPLVHRTAPPRGGSGRTHLVLGGVRDAESGGGHGFEPGRPDRLPAHLAAAVGAAFEALDRRVDFVEGLAELGRQPLGLAALRGHLAGIGKVRVVIESAALVSEAELLQLGLEAGLLVAQQGGEVDVGGLRRGGLVRHALMLRGPSPRGPARGCAPS